MKTISCFVVDDERDARERLAILLTKFDDVKVIGMEGDPEQAIESILHKKPDLVFIDVEMPRMSGFDVVKAIKSKDFHPTFIFVTDYNQYAIKAIKNEAFDFLLKPVDIDELKDTLHRFRECHKLQYGTGTGQHIPLDEVHLSEREKEILRLLVQCKTSRQIAEELFISKNTVDTHRRNLLEKTGLKNTHELILWAIENGMKDEK
ncbi:MAG: response regulator transcription factor [Bacteroidetes bacterium]|nr:response regulator transcription factor [Bacteroidota bacterium]